MNLEVKREKRGDTCWVAVTGEVDLYSSPELRRALTRAWTSKHSRIEVDLSGVEYMDSSGVATLVEGLRATNGKGTRFVLRGPSPPVKKVLHLSRLDTVFEIEDAG